MGGGGEDLLTDIFPFWSVVLDLFWMLRAQPELDTVRAVADPPEEVSVDVDEAEEGLLGEPPWTRRPEDVETSHAVLCHKHLQVSMYCFP